MGRYLRHYDLKRFCVVCSYNYIINNKLCIYKIFGTAIVCIKIEVKYNNKNKIKEIQNDFSKMESNQKYVELE